MVIKNTTTFSNEHIKKIMTASQFSNNKYKTFKLIYNGFGLLAGMMFIRYYILNMLGNEQYDRIIMYAFGAAAVICLYIGMYGMDKGNLKKYKTIYKEVAGITYNYEIDSDLIRIEEGEKSKSQYEIPWENVIKVEQDIDNFYIFTDEMQACVLSKKGFTECEAKDFAELYKAIFSKRAAERENIEN